MISSPDRVRTERFAAIEKRWPTGIWDAYGQPRGRAWIEDLRRTTFVVTFPCLGTAGLLEISLVLRRLTDHPDFLLLMADLIPRGMGLRTLAWLAPLLLLNAWLLDGFLRDQAVDPRPLAPGFRALTAGILAIPVFGLPGLPAWAWLAARRPQWVFRTAVAPPHPRPAPAFFSGLRRRLERWRRKGAGSLPALVLWLCCGQLLGFNLLQALILGAGTPIRIFAWCALCHLASFVAVGLYLETRRVRAALAAGDRRRLWAAASLILLPLPFPLLSLALWHRLTEEAREEKTLTFLGVISRWRMPLLARPRSLTGWRLGASRLSFGSASAALDSSLGRREESRQAFYRAKTFWVGLDAAALTLVLGLCGFSAQTLVLGYKPFYGFYALALAGGAGELVAFARRLLSWFRRQPLPAYLGAGHFLAATQIALAMGYCLGLLLVEGSRKETLVFLSMLSIAACVATLFVGLAGKLLGLPGSRTSVTGFWMATFVGIIALSLVVERWSHGEALFDVLEGALYLAPLLSLFLGWRSLPVLVDPFKVRDLFDPVRKSRASLPLRFLAVTALLPLGGLFVPLWVLLRERLPALYGKHRR